MNYKEIEAYLLEIPKFTKKNTLEDTGLFLRELGNPCQKKTVIHIAGTNGKGSVCAYLSSVLNKGGYRVGMFTSPHLVTMRERFRMGNKYISRECFVRCFERIKQQLEEGNMPQLPLEAYMLQQGGFPIQTTQQSKTPVMKFLQLKSGDVRIVPYDEQQTQQYIAAAIEKVTELFNIYSAGGAGYEYRETGDQKYKGYDDLARIKD